MEQTMPRQAHLTLKKYHKKKKKLPQSPDAVVKLFQCDRCLQLSVGHDTHIQAKSNIQMINPDTERNFNFRTQ